MNNGLKQRLIGAVVLVAVAVLILPSFLRNPQMESVSTKTLIPDQTPPETLTFGSPQAPDNIEPAPQPDTMFMPPSDQAAVAPLDEPAQDNPPAGGEREGTEAPMSDEATSDAAARATAEEPPAAAEAVASGESAWVVQVISYRSSESARELRNRLQSEGHRAYVRSASVDGASVSRVYIGPKISRADAEAAKAEVDRLLKVDALILRFEP